MIEWIKDHQALVWMLGVLSLVILAASLFIAPVILTRIPADYFTHKERPASEFAIRSPAWRVVWRVGKNLLGVVLVLGGLAMLVTPGQGLVTLLIGFLLIEFPGKYRLERWLFSRPLIRRPINWLRTRAGREPLSASYRPAGVLPPTRGPRAAR